MYQVAVGGYYDASEGIDQFYDNPVYYEPGFRPMEPLILDVVEADRIYILVRKRLNAAETDFDSLVTSNLIVEATDATNGENVPAVIYDNNIHDEWNTDPSFTPLVLYLDAGLDINNPVMKVRTIDCTITDITDNTFISFRVNVPDSGLYFHYIIADIYRLDERYSFTAVGREAYVPVSDKGDSYILFSPFAYLSETNKESSDFSYPLNSVYYKRQQTYNNEDFYFTLGSTNYNFVLDQISLINVPNFRKVAVLHVDSNMYSKLQQTGAVAYVNVVVRGEMSDYEDTFKINFIRQ